MQLVKFRGFLMLAGAPQAKYTFLRGMPAQGIKREARFLCRVFLCA